MTYGNQLAAMGLSNTKNKEVREKIQEAYCRAHDIRKFEIELYWKRSSYLWTIQAAAFGGVAVVSGTTDSLGWFCQHQETPNVSRCAAMQIRTISLAAIWCFGLFSAYVWLLLLRGSKFWQNNWERHVDALEEYVSGDLYKTYRVRNTQPPYSVSKLNELMALFSVLVWGFIGIAAALVFGGTQSWILWLLPALALLLFFACYFDECLRMSEFGEVIDQEVNPDKTVDFIMSRKIAIKNGRR
jgi:hypothetical protein